MKKKLMSLVLVGVMAATMFTGCGSSESTDASSDAASGSSDAASTESGSASNDENTLTVWCWDPAFNISEKCYDISGCIYRSDRQRN